MKLYELIADLVEALVPIIVIALLGLAVGVLFGWIHIPSF